MMGLRNNQSIDDLFSATFGELRTLASDVRSWDKSMSLSSTALVHEAWIELSASPAMKAVSELHFKERLAARAMRLVLIEAARKRNSLSRAAPPAIMVGEELIALDRVVDGLARTNPRPAMVVESRFGGLKMAEIA